MKTKHLPIYILFIFISGIIQAQNPQAFKYQAVARDASGYPIIDSDISLQIEIYTVNGNSTANYIENHFVTTNNFGLINLDIGNGEIVEGDFSAIDWGNGNQFIDISLDINGGTDFSPMGTSQILSVPMASYAAIAGNVVDTSITNELQTLALSHLGDLSISPGGNSVDLSIFSDSAAIQEVNDRVSNDSIYFEGELVIIRQSINGEVIRATQAEEDLAALINQNAIDILSDSLYFQYLIDNLSSSGNGDSLYFQTLIDANTQMIIADSTFLKSLIDQNTLAIQQEITRAILAEIINAGNINNNTLAIASIQTKLISDSTFLKGLIDQNSISITAEITRAILAEIMNANNISANAVLIAQNTLNISQDSANFQTQMTQFNFDLQQEITRAIYHDQINSDSIQLTYAKLIADSTYFQTQIDGLAGGGGLDPTLENGKIFIGNAANVATGVNMTGDAQMTNTGVLMIGPSAITTSKVADGNITNNKLSNSSFTISDDMGNSGQVDLGSSLQFNANGATAISYNAATATMDITSTDNQLLNVSGNNLSISSGNAVDLSAIVGQVGPQGPAGPQGATGPQGLAGNDGANGAVGPQGPQGIAGNDGADGAIGPQGAQGPIGPQGVQGPTGPQGVTGPQGNDGVGVQSTVDNGDGTFTITYTDGSTFTTADFTGPTGLQGPTGPQGVVGPQGNDGVGVQSTVDNGNGTFTITYTDGSTFTTADFTGPTGLQGPTGPQGVVGPQGNNGIGIQSTVNNGDGTFTITYTDGSTFTTADFTGPTGIQGLQGIDGPQGVTGPQGAQGIQGVAGSNGISITWLGTVWPAPASPNVNDAYRNPVDKKSYIWNGTVWQTIAQDGLNGLTGPQGPTGPQGETGTSLRDCPAGGWSEINEEFCIEVSERVADTWWNASKICGDLNAHLCSWNEWYYVCQKAGSGTVNMGNDWEWTDDGQAGATPTATVVGNGSCTSSDTDNMSSSNKFRCCFSR